MFRLFKNIVFLVWLVGALTSLSIGLAWCSLQLTTGIARLTAEATATALKHRKEIANTVAKTKAKARLRRVLVMVPIAGIAAGVYFEEQDYQEWKHQNPNRNRQDYACEVAAFTAEALEELLQETPDTLIPSQDRLTGQLSNCAAPE